MIELLQRSIAWLMNRVRVNQIERGILDGAPVFMKRRRASSSIVIGFANQFLAFAGSGVFMFVRADDWINWEVYCSGLLYPDRPCVKIGPGRTVNVAEVHGTSLRQLLSRREMDLKPIIAAARELRRVHHLDCRSFRAAWSHGDLHLDNILYDRVADRAILIDFDTRHESGIDPMWRHGDDLKVFLMELIASHDENWLQLATAFVDEYRDSSVLHELSRQLFVPLGFAGILWFARTNCWSTRKIEPRLKLLRAKLHQMTTAALIKPETQSP